VQKFRKRRAGLSATAGLSCSDVNKTILSFDSLGVTRPLGSIDPRLYKLTTDDDDDYEPPDNHIGRVWFGVKYEAQSEKLFVTLVKAKNLASRVSAAAPPSSGTAGDFFVRYRLAGYLSFDDTRSLPMRTNN